MLNDKIVNDFAAILAAAQKKAESQNNGTKIPDVKQAAAALKTKIENNVPVPTPSPVNVSQSPIFAYRQPFDLSALIKKVELSNVTVDDILNDASPVINLQIIDYSDKAIAVIGDTIQVKDKLKSLGGKYNQFLKCGAGWIFPKWKEDDVRNALSL